ncbi:MAG: hypothetical protein R3B70_49220, partial [Polyangiaceae bacterium]
PSPLEVTAPSVAGGASPRSSSPSRSGEAPRSSSPSRSGEAPRSSSPSRPGETSRRSDAEPPVSTPRPAGALSLPPPSAPGVSGSLPPPARSGSALDFCGSCKAPVEKGDTCARCGWNNGEKLRHCRQCKKTLVLRSKVSKSPALLGGIAVASLALAGGSLVLFGALAAVAAVGVGVALGFVADAATLRYACRTCTVAVYTARLVKDEEVRIASGKRRSFTLAAVLGALAIALFVLPAGAARKLTSTSFSGGWSVDVPSTHSRVDSEVQILDLPAGQKRIRVQLADRNFLSAPTYYLANVQYSYPSGPAAPDKAAVKATLEKTISTVFAGSVTGAVESDGESFHAAFTGTFRGKSVAGRIRATQYDHDIVLVAVTAGSDSDLRTAAIDQYLRTVSLVSAPPK